MITIKFKGVRLGIQTIEFLALKFCMTFGCIALSYLAYIKCSELGIRVLGLRASSWMIFVYGFLGGIICYSFLYYILKYLTYLLKCTHITSIVYSFQCEGEVANLSSSFSLIKARFLDISGFFAFEEVFKKIRFEVFSFLTNKTKTRFGILNLLLGGLISSINFSLGYIDELCFAYVIASDEKNKPKVLVNSLINFVKNYKAILKKSLELNITYTFLKIISFLIIYIGVYIQFKHLGIIGYISSYFITCFLAYLVREIVFEHFILCSFLAISYDSIYSQDDSNYEEILEELRANIPSLDKYLSKYKIFNKLNLGGETIEKVEI